MEAFQPDGVFVVDRIEGRGIVVVVDDDGRSIDLRPGQLATAYAEEGAVLRVSKDRAGDWDWTGAKRDLEEEERRRARGAARLKRLGERDPGGDVSL